MILLFKTALENEFQTWKRLIGDVDWLTKRNFERFTNTRYAEDILLYAKSLDELIFMLELLQKELAIIGVQMHDMKTKIYNLLHNIKMKIYKLLHDMKIKI